MNRILFSLLAATVAAAPLVAQDGLPPVIPLNPAGQVVPTQAQAASPPATVPCPVPAPVVFPTTTAPSSGPRVRGSAEFLLWFFGGTRVDTPLILTNRNPSQDLAASFTAGSLADPGAVAVFGGSQVGPRTFPGFRAMIGMDLTDDGHWGVELGGFWLPQQVSKFTITSNSGTPVIVLPYFNINPAPLTGGLGESGGVFAGNFAGTQLGGFAQAVTATQLWGSDLNLTCLTCQRGNVRVEGLVGFRYVGMSDLLTLTAGITQNGNGAIFDRFSTLNNFYGPQIGLRGEWHAGMVSFSASQKLAFGVTNEEMDISGTSVLPSGSAALGPQLPGGFYTSAANIGRTDQTHVAIVSETNLTARIAITKNISLTAGYSLFYWSDVQRAGENVTRLFNPTFNPAFAPLIGVPPLSGPVPPRLNQTTDFWAHGLNLGVQVDF